MNKNYVPRKEIEMIKRAWRCNTGGVKDMYEKVLKSLFFVLSTKQDKSFEMFFV